MRRCLLVLALISLLLLNSGCTKDDAGKLETRAIKILSEEKEIKLNVEIADSDEEWQNGLMQRENLGQDEGMLFVYPSERSLSFWMKNTLIPLDLIFISSDGTIVDIKEDFQPCRTDFCESYRPKAEVMYVVEVNAGFTQEKDIKIGDKLVI